MTVTSAALSSSRAAAAAAQHDAEGRLNAGRAVARHPVLRRRLPASSRLSLHCERLAAQAREQNAWWQPHMPHRLGNLVAAAASGSAAAEPPTAATDAAGLVAASKTEDAAAAAVLRAACVAAMLAAVHRVAFSVLAIPLQQEFQFTPQQMGMLHSALLVGYLLAQVPSGLIADRMGGARLLLSALLLWSSACALTSLVPASGSPFVFLLAVRAALGLAQSCLMPAVSALAARWFPPHRRSSGTSNIYGCYSAGTVAGLVLTPLLAAALDWRLAFAVLGCCGVVYALLTLPGLPTEGRVQQQQLESGQQADESPAASSAATAAPAPPALGWLDRLLLLCFAHSVISFTFFVTQAWIPTFLHSAFDLQDLGLVGLLSALPWLGTALVATLAGRLADWLQTARCWPQLQVRRVMQGIAFGGTAAALLPLGLAGMRLPPSAAMLALVVAVSLQGLNYSGFHAHVQDVSPQQAGLILGITNTCGVLAGIAGNLGTGQLAGSGPGGFAAVFLLTACLSAAGAAAWLAWARGDALRLPG